MEKILMIVQIVISILLAVSVLLQNRGAGLSSTFGGDFGGYYTKRGFEKFLYWSSICLGVVFIVTAAAIAYISSHAV
jgi:protein translocase SecG subunit